MEVPHASIPQTAAALPTTLPVPGGALPVRWPVVALALSLLMMLIIGESGHSGPSLTTAWVVRGTATSAVTATGSLHAISEQKLRFPEGGRLTELDVSVGDRVTAGQVLAKTDNTAQQVELRKAKDQVVKEQASLDQIKAGNQVDGANAALAWQRDLLAAVQETTVQTDRSDAAEIDQAERVLEFDRSELIRQLKRLEVTQERCDKSKVLGTSATTETSVDTGAQTGNTKAQTSHCDRVEDRRNDVVKAKRDVLKDVAEVDKARKKRDIDRPTQQSKIDDAQHDLTEDENRVGLASTDRRYTIEKQQAALDPMPLSLESSDVYFRRSEARWSPLS
ncbi:MAG: biotin/lipoyl-binding protein [Pseudonocardiaceae bacterium]